MCKSSLNLKRGEVYWFDLAWYNYQGTYIGMNGKTTNSTLMIKKRPYLVIGVNAVLGTANIIPMTSNIDHNISHSVVVNIIPNCNMTADEHNSFIRNAKSTVLTEQIFTIDIDCIGNFIGNISESDLNKVQVSIIANLGIKVSGLEMIYSLVDTLISRKEEEIRSSVIKEYDERSNMLIDNIVGRLSSLADVKTSDTVEEPPETVSTSAQPKPEEQKASRKFSTNPTSYAGKQKKKGVKRLPNKKWTQELKWMFCQDVLSEVKNDRLMYRYSIKHNFDVNNLFKKFSEELGLTK